MTTNRQDESDRAAHRSAIERIIAHYPDISEDELFAVIQYFRNEASAFDRGMIASNEEIRPQYRQFCDDHRLDRLKVVETAVAVLFVFLLVVAILFLTLGVWEW